MALSWQFIVAYIALATTAAVLCSVSLFGIVKTKRTVYATRLFSAGLLVVDLLFLVLSSVSKFFPYNDIFWLQHVARGLHISSWTAVLVMSLERLLAVNWPYQYIKMVTKRRARIVCAATYVLGFLQYAMIRVLVCYISSEATNCNAAFKIYLLLLLTMMPIISSCVYFKLYLIVRESFKRCFQKQRMSEFKGTFVSFLYMTNTFVCSLIYLISSVFMIVTGLDSHPDGGLGIITDFITLVNCYIDPLIYVIWYRETKLELLKVAQTCLPRLKPKIQKMQTEVYNIQIYVPNRTNDK